MRIDLDQRASDWSTALIRQRELPLILVAIGLLGASAFAFARLGQGRLPKIFDRSRVRALYGTLAGVAAALSLVHLAHALILRPVSRSSIRSKIHTKGLPKRYTHEELGSKRRSFQRRSLKGHSYKVMLGAKKGRHSGKYLVVRKDKNAHYTKWTDCQWAFWADSGWTVVVPKKKGSAKQIALAKALESKGKKVRVARVKKNEGDQSDFRKVRIRDYVKSQKRWDSYKLDCSVEARLLPATRKKARGKALIIALGANVFYQDYDMTDFDALRGEGYAVALYNPPGAGLSPGMRTPEQDAQAIRSVFSALEAQGYEAENISAVGYSFGSAPAAMLATEKPVERLCLVVPIDDMATMGERLVSKRMGAFSPLVTWIPRLWAQMYYPCDNKALIASSQAKQLIIVQASNDEMTAGGSVPAAADRLAAEWDGEEKVDRIEVEGGHTTSRLYRPAQLLTWLA